MRIWIKDPLAILAPGAERGLVVDGAQIVECVPRGRSPTIAVGSTFDASRHVVLPGLVNTHHHLYQTLTRAHPAGEGKDLIPWLVAMERVWDRTTPEALSVAVRLGLVELLLSGCTTTADHHNLFPPGLEGAIDIEVEEATAVGLRMTVTRGSMGISEKDGGLQPDSIVQSSDTILEDSDRVLRRYHDPSPGSLLRVALAPCSPLAVPQRVLTESARLVEAYDARLHCHLCQSPDEDAYALATFGKRSVDLLEDAGWLGPRTWVAHGIHFNADEIARLGRAGVGVGHLPAADMAFGVGICPTRELEAAGAPVGLGVDGSASNDSSNMMEAVRHALMLQRLRYGHAAVSPYDALRWATEGGARCLGRDDIGRIAPGLQADLALYRVDEPRFSGAHDFVAALVLCGATHADRVMVAGRWRVIDGRPEGLDLAALVAQHKAAAKAFG
ncbi:8-oxoguanine deaminase [Roseiarcus fermentans]|uniref:8-oxoguanine deaminase n=1 Tax=Roseiarcus fermentans TaxID=1473586 RepID=A0A366F4Y1_9HYPH|nr:8-oxoguanine deaminase [Roseiarcus fermentans]RBP09701.1 8-oxoguanine deaminase [Roseiarcus fermentans]